MDTRAPCTSHFCQLSYLSFDDINYRVQKPDAEAIRIQQKQAKGRQTKLNWCISTDPPGIQQPFSSQRYSPYRIGFKNILK